MERCFFVRLTLKYVRPSQMIIDAENLRQHKIRFSVIVEQIPLKVLYKIKSAVLDIIFSNFLQHFRKNLDSPKVKG